MRRLLLLVEGLGLRGADKIAVEWAKLFAQAGHEAVLGCCGASRGGVFGVEPPEGVEVVSGSPEEIVRAFPDAVVAINSSATALGALPILRGVAKRLVLIAHSAGTWVEPFVVGGAHKTWDAVVALSPHVAARLASFGIPTAKLWTIPALVQKVDRTSAARCGAREALGIPDGAFVVGYAGRADFQKGVPDLAVVLSGLVRRGVDARVLFAGLSDPTSPSPQQDQCRQVMRMFATQGGVLDRVVEMPATSDLEIFWQAIDAFALLSKTEGASLVLREAIACGVPVVATLAGDAHAWAVETEGSFVVPVYAGIDFERLEGIADKFATIARRSPEERERMSAQAERRAEPILKGQSKDVQTVRVLDRVLSAQGRGLPKILLLSDVRGWAFDANLQDMAAYLSDEFDFFFWYVADGVPFPHEGTYDAVYAPFHRWKVVVDGTLPMDRTLGSLRSRWFYAEVPVPPSQAEFDLVNQFRAFHVVTRPNLDELKGACPRVVYLTNPVNMRRFPSPTVVRDRVVASWNGNAQHRNAVERDVKGFYSIILPACAIAKVHLEFAEYHIRRKALHEMPEFYQLANLAVCASLYEGACGLGDSPVTMSDGTTRRLDQVKIGDRVRARDGSIQRVENAWCAGTPPTIVEIVAWGCKRFYFTEEHQWPVWSWSRECLCGCGGAVTQGRLWKKDHSGSRGRKIRPVHVFGDTRNRSAAYRVLPPGYDPQKRLRSGEIAVGDFVMIPRRFEEFPTSTTPEQARLLGYYAAEGSILKNHGKDYAVEFSFNSSEELTWIADTRGILAARGIAASDHRSKRSKTHAIRTTTSMRAARSQVQGLIRWLRGSVGTGAHAKAFSREVMTWPLALKRELLTGLLRGDGSETWKRGKTSGGNSTYSFMVCLGTASRQLAGQVQLILAQLGYPASIVKVPAHKTPITVYGKTYTVNAADFYHVVVSNPWARELGALVWGAASKRDKYPPPDRAQRRPDCLVDADFVYLPVRSVRVIPNDKPVYNLTVSGDHSYLVDNVATFNSNSVMEAMAAGQALLTTDVGNVREMQDSQIEHFGDTGIVVVDRTVGAFCDALERLKKDPARIVEMGRLNRAEIEARWSWDVWRGRYADFLRSGL